MSFKILGSLIVAWLVAGSIATGVGLLMELPLVFVSLLGMILGAVTVLVTINVTNPWKRKE